MRQSPAIHRLLKERVGILSSIVGLVCTVIFVSTFNLHPAKSDSGRRYLSALDHDLERSSLLPWAQHNFVDVMERPDPSKETALFWHIPKSGGTTAKGLYECLGQTLANRLGADPRFGHDKDNEIVVFHPFVGSPEIKFVNVDATSKKGILRAAELGLVASKKVDMIFTADVNFAADHLFDPDHKGRLFALFRNPIDRSVSKFYYLQTATWERTYRPEWKGMGIVEWATYHNLDENFIVKKIVGKKLSEAVDLRDLVVAKEIIQRRFVLGLMNDMEESIRRFNIVLGLDFKGEKGLACREQYLSSNNKTEVIPDDGTEQGQAKAADKKNSNPHPKVEEGSPEYNVLAERNALDMILFHYITILYGEQKNVIDSYANTQYSY